MAITKTARQLAASIFLLGAASMNADAQSFSPRLSTPRVAPVSKEGLTDAQQKMLASRADYNIYKTLAHHVELYNRWSPLGQYLLNGSGIPARDREIAMLRMGWLCQSPYEWSQHARIAQGADVGLSAADVHRIAEGPDAKGWGEFDRTLLRMVDEMRYETMISDATWKALRTKYTTQQIIDVMYTASQYQLVSMALNSLGVQLDPMLKDFIPTDVMQPKMASTPMAARLGVPRIKPIPLSAMTDEQRELVKPVMRDGAVPNLYATLAVHPKFYTPRRTFGSYVQRESGLPAKSRELLIMRTAWNIRAEYEWSHHVPLSKEAGLTDAEIARIAKGPTASGWSEEHAALLSAADELRREAFIGDATWKTLSKYYSTQRLVDIIYTVGGYTMTGIAINSLGIQVEDGYTRFPK